MVIRLCVVAAAVVMILAAMSPRPAAGGQPAPGQEDPASSDQGQSAIPFDLTDPRRIEAGKARFHSACADFCHGHEPVLFIGRKIDPTYAHDVIVNGGRGATPMPPWGDVFSSEEIWELVAYLEFLGDQKPK